MSAKIIELKDKDKQIIYPVTVADAVYMPNGEDTVGRFIRDFDDENTHIEFNSRSIVKTLASGTKVETVFSNNVITEKTIVEGKTVSTKTTRFNSDGSVDIEVS